MSKIKNDALDHCSMALNLSNNSSLEQLALKGLIAFVITFLLTCLSIEIPELSVCLSVC